MAKSRRESRPSEGNVLVLEEDGNHWEEMICESYHRERCLGKVHVSDMIFEI